ncbi:MAG: flagellar motor switch protein FliN [Bacteroidota bacterium]|jgi:type III secretion system YscQ/HrcQ family protein
MLFKRKSNKFQHNLNVSILQTPHLSKQQLIFNQFLLKKTFIWQDKQINVLNINASQKAEHYIGIHTEYGIFYIHNGMSWIQKLTSIHIEHEDEDTQNWLLERALENLPTDAFPLEITGLSFHHYINTNKYNALCLHGFSSKTIYTTIETWIKLFSKYKFIRKHSFNIDSLDIVKNILLGKQKLQYTDYKKLVCGNIILVNNNNFNLDGVGNIELGSFIMLATYHDNTLIFQAWNNNMNDKPYTENQDEEEWNQEESTLTNEYGEFDYNYNELNQFNAEHTNTDSSEQEYQEQNEETQTDIDDSEQNVNDVQEDAAHPFGNVPIHLSFSLGTLRMPIANVMQLQEGSVIELHKATPAQVNIYANSKLIGTGDVIEIDGKIGVQITKLEKD